MYNQKKIGIIGAGDIGFNLAELLAIKGYKVSIYNRYHKVDDRPSPHYLSKMGKVMDINDSLQMPGCFEINLTSNLDDLNEHCAIVITAGAKRSSPDETREELAKKNAKIMDEFVPLIVANPDSLILIISNPVDFLTQYLIENVANASGKSKEEVAKKIVGVSLIDSMRLSFIVKEFMAKAHPEVVVERVDSISIGEHGLSMVPLVDSVLVNGVNLSYFTNEEEREKIRSQTVLRGNDIIKLTGTSSIHGPSHAALYMLEKIINNNDIEVSLPASVFDGERAIGMLSVFKNYSFQRIATMKMSQKERDQLEASKKAIDSQYKSVIS